MHPQKQTPQIFIVIYVDRQVIGFDIFGDFVAHLMKHACPEGQRTH